MPIFDSACYVAGSQFHIPAFGSRRNPAPTTSGPQAANEAVKRRKAELRKLAEADDVIRYDKYHAANLIAKPNPTATIAAASNQPPPASHLTPLTLNNPSQPEHVQNNSCHVTPTPGNAEHEPATSRTRNVEGEQRERLTEVKQKRGEAEEHEQVAEKVETTQGEYTPPPTALAEHGEHGSEFEAHKVVHANAFAAEPRANDTRPGEYDPPPSPPDPPPPIRDTTRTPQVDPIRIRSDRHDEEHNERALALVVTNAVEPLNNGSRGATATAAAATATATATTTDAAADATATATAATATATAATATAAAAAADATPPPHPHPPQIPLHPAHTTHVAPPLPPPPNWPPPITTIY
jgi:hypothetical protein